MRASVASYLSACNSQSRQIFSLVRQANRAVLRDHHSVASTGVSGQLTAIRNNSTSACNTLLSDMLAKTAWASSHSLSFASKADGEGCGSVYNLSRTVHSLQALMNGVAPTGTEEYSSGDKCN